MKKVQKLRLITGFFALFLSVFLVYLLVLDFSGLIPTEYNLQMGDTHIINTRFPLSFVYDREKRDVLEINELKAFAGFMENFGSQLEISTLQQGTMNLQYRILGLIPYKTVTVNVVPKFQVYPGGQSIGVKLNTEGVLVVGLANITLPSGEKVRPGESGGVKVGDTLLAIDGQEVENAFHVADLIQGVEDQPMSVTIRRNGVEQTLKVTPVLDNEGQYRVGLWVRDKTAGVGTLTFFHEGTNIFGALGHGITDMDTGGLMSIKDGEAISARVIDIEAGKRGKPGELKGIFHDVNRPLGVLIKNTEYGVYGEMLQDLAASSDRPLEIAYQHEIKEGPAYILTTLDDNKIETYHVEVLKVSRQSSPNSKGMIIRVTDPALLQKTGGIVQGMSGSPIIQNNKLIGAVTHVLINDPTRGYGIFIEWMLQESGVFDREQYE